MSGFPKNYFLQDHTVPAVASHSRIKLADIHQDIYPKQGIKKSLPKRTGRRICRT
jgi:hypothetical protein